MVLPRVPEPFDRVYSPPDPPSTARRSAVVGLFTALVAFCVATSAILVVFSDGEDGSGSGGGSGEGGAEGSATASRRPASSAGSAGSTGRTPARTGPPPAARAPVLTSLPPPCATVRRTTVDRLVPRAESVHSANTTLATCTYAATGTGAAQWLRVETRIFDSLGGTEPVRTATGFFATQWTRARQAPVVRTVSLTRYAGLGDEAYRWYKIDEGQPTVVGEVAVRLRNAVITVSYSGMAAGAGDDAASERKYLTEATGVAREVVSAMQ